METTWRVFKKWDPFGGYLPLGILLFGIYIEELSPRHVLPHLCGMQVLRDPKPLTPKPVNPFNGCVHAGLASFKPLLTCMYL